MEVSALKQGFLRRAIWLSWFTIGYNLIEGAVSIAFGVSEGSIALAGFGVDSLIEVASAFIVLWRFKGEAGGASHLTVKRERAAVTWIGVLFISLALLTVAAAIIQITEGAHPQTTLPGAVISAVSLSFMFYLWNAKVKTGRALESPTVLKDAACSLACIKLSMVLFSGSVAFLFFPVLWWADAAAAVVLGLLIGKEGWDTVKAARRDDFDGCCGCK